MTTSACRRALAAVIAAVALLGACGTMPPQSEAERRREHSAQAHQRASEALARGDHGRALSHYEAALARNRAVESQDAVAVNLLNLAAVLHRAGDFAGARARLTELIRHDPPFEAGYVGRAEARLALLELQLWRTAEAAQHAARADDLCSQAQCPWRAALLTVLAGIALENGDLDAAAGRAREAQAAAARSGDRQEEANAWRMLGEVAGRTGRSDEARAALSAALDIDRAIEAPDRIALDLLALARLELAQDRRAEARGYARRAAAVAESARLAGLVAAARELLRELEQPGVGQ